jgi:hypothetical protein
MKKSQGLLCNSKVRYADSVVSETNWLEDSDNSNIVRLKQIKAKCKKSGKKRGR